MIHMGRRSKNYSPLGMEIQGAVIASGYSDAEAAAVIGVARTAWIDRLHDPGLFRAREIRQLRKILPDEVCDRISK